VAQNVAWTLAERFHAATTLIDLDVAFGTAGLNFDEDAETGVGEALQKADQLDQTYLERLLVRRSEHLSLFPASAALERDFEAAPPAYEALIEQVRRIAPFVVLDLPHTWSRWMRNTVLAADDVIIVATPDLASLRNSKNLFDIIRSNRPHDSPPALVLNRVGVPKRPEIPVKDFAKAVAAEPLTIIPFDPAVFGAASNAGQMVIAAAPDSRPALGLETVARALCGREPPARRKTSILSRVLKRCGQNVWPPRRSRSTFASEAHARRAAGGAAAHRARRTDRFRQARAASGCDRACVFCSDCRRPGRSAVGGILPDQIDDLRRADRDDRPGSTRPGRRRQRARGDPRHRR
jgi:Flp pilus assembly CpaE family ATPase